MNDPAEGAPEGLLVVTKHQSAGRGRQGRSWWDAPGDSLLASLLSLLALLAIVAAPAPATTAQVAQVVRASQVRSFLIGRGFCRKSAARFVIKKFGISP